MKNILGAIALAFIIIVIGNTVIVVEHHMQVIDRRRMLDQARRCRTHRFQQLGVRKFRAQTLNRDLHASVETENGHGGILSLRVARDGIPS